MKKKSNLSTLMEYAGKYKVLTYLSWVLSGISALVALVPFIYIWKIIKEILDNISDLKNAENLAYYYLKFLQLRLYNIYGEKSREDDINGYFQKKNKFNDTR